MKIRAVLCFIFTLAALIGWAGCAADAPVNTEPSPPETTLAAASEETAATLQEESSPSTEEETPTEVPFGKPEELTYLSYEEYFSQERSYERSVGGDDGAPNSYISSTAWQWKFIGGYVDVEYALKRDNSDLVVIGPNDAEYGRLQLAAEYTDCDWVLADGYWIYGVRNGNELFRMDFTGANIETLFLDENYTLGVQNEIDLLGMTERFAFTLLDHCVLFFPVCSVDTGSWTVCRLYIPDLQADMLYEIGNTTLDDLSPKSNFSFTWSEDNPELTALVQQLTQDPSSPYYQQGGDVAYRISVNYNIPSQIFHYYNAQTGELSIFDPGD